MLAGCGESQPPFGAPGAMRQNIGALMQSGNSGHSYRVLFDFGSNVLGLDGAGPVAPLIAVNGTLYGTTEYGGKYYFRSNLGAGTVYSVSTSGLNERVLLSFEAYEGGPIAGLVAEDGILYGTTVGGGRYNGGMVFRMSTTGSNYRVLHSFGKGSDGAQPRAGLTVVKGILYGTTYQGGTGCAGSGGCGTVFRVTKNGDERVMHSFTGQPDGEYPMAGLIDLNGTLDGTTEFGGIGAGTVFSISTDGTERVLYKFGNRPDGEHPVASLIALNGTLYGTTIDGGSADGGTVFSLTGTNERVLHSFGQGADGSGPQASVVALKGVLYGTTSAGGTGSYGTVFRVGVDGSERVLHNFAYGENDGLDPLAALTNVKGTLYGTTASGGISLPSCPRSASQSCDYGTVFALAP